MVALRCPDDSPPTPGYPDGRKWLSDHYDQQSINQIELGFGTAFQKQTVGILLNNLE